MSAGSAPAASIARKADFTRIRYAQVWEDGQALLDALEVRPGERCLSICSAGDNALLLLAREPSSVLAIDINPAQLACLELRVAAIRSIRREDLLGLLGSRPLPAGERLRLYQRCRPALGEESRRFWDARPQAVANGIGACGKFEGYFKIFRSLILPLAHGSETVRALLASRDRSGREEFFAQRWDTWRWRALFHLFFSRSVMGALGRSPRFFDHVDGPVAARILSRVRHALVELDPSRNPWLHWILLGRHFNALPPWLEPDNYEKISSRIDRLSWRRCSLEDALDEGAEKFDRFNLSDIFEYMSGGETARLLEKIASASNAGARLVYWNMLAPRSRPPELAGLLRPLDDLARSIHLRDRAFFYSRLVIEERLPGS